MPSPKTGKSGRLVGPAAPRKAVEAGNAKSGEVSDTTSNPHQGEAGEYGSTKFKPHKKDPAKTGWIEIMMTDEKDKPVIGQRYRVVLPDGETAAEGTLDENGFARIEGFDPGSCYVSFPTLDRSAWEPK